MIIEVFEKAFALAKERGWKHIAVAVDLHGTVFRPTYSDELAIEYYDKAQGCLKLMSEEYEGITPLMYMYTCTPYDVQHRYMNFFRRSQYITMYTKDVVQAVMKIENNSFQNFEDKPYFNVLLEDKAGFNPDRDWDIIHDYFKNKKQC
jgi:hypothetical protein